MSIEKDSKWVKDGEVVEVVDVVVINYEDHVINLILYVSKKDTERVGFLRIDKIHTLTERDFLEQYKPYEVVYEYQYAIKIKTGMGNILKIDNLIYLSDEYKHSISGTYYTDNEKKPVHWISYQRLDFTKRERKQ